MSWTDERVELLKKLWQDGLSASQIANELGGVTRNAVIGKVHRLGLSGRAKSTATSVQRQRKAVKPATKTLLFHGSRGTMALAPVLMTVAQEEAAPQIAPVAAVVVIPMTRRVSIMELREGVCRWPLGDPLQSDFAFCGNDCGSGATYCGHHASIAFQPSSDRRRERRI